MASKKLYRVNKNSIMEVKELSTYWCEMAFKMGYVFIKKTDGESVYMLNSTTSLKTLDMNLVEVKVVD